MKRVPSLAFDGHAFAKVQPMQPPKTVLTIEIDHTTGAQMMRLSGTPLSFVLVASVLTTQLQTLITEMVKQSAGIITVPKNENPPVDVKIEVTP
jgi:hypothetical protein